MKHAQMNIHRTTGRLARGITACSAALCVMLAAGCGGGGPEERMNVEETRIQAADAGVNTIAKRVKIWMKDNGHSSLPSSFTFTKLTEGDTPYIKESYLIDPWNNPYVLVNPGKVNSKFDIVSYGADGVEGGEGPNKDLVAGE